MTELQPHVVRVTLFYAGDSRVSPDEILRLYKIDSEFSQKDASKRQELAVGSFGAGKLQATVAPGRLDIVWQTQVQQEFLGLGKLVDVYPAIRGPIVDLLRKNQWKRVALGIHAAAPVDAVEDGYALLATKLPRLQLDAKTGSDFIYQINRFCELKISQGPVRINRLAKWLVGKIIYSTGRFDGTTTDLVLETTAQQEQILANLELDINSTADLIPPLEGEDVVKILDFASDSASEFIENGDS